MIALYASLALAGPWTTVAPGAEYRAITWIETPAHGDGVLHIVRIDPTQAKLHLGVLSAGSQPIAAKAWSQTKQWAVVTNAGMYDVDFTTHVGYLRVGTAVNASRWAKYQSAMVWGPRKPGLAATAMVDADTHPSFSYDDYDVVIQNLRLIKHPGENRWKRNGKKWSESALAVDADGRVLFLFSRSPLTMNEFNAKLLGTDLTIVAAQHLEGGPEASLSVHGGGIDLDLCGSYETGFTEHDNNQHQWSLPNVIGIGR